MTTQLTSEEIDTIVISLQGDLDRQLSLRHVWRPDRPDYTARQRASIRTTISALRKARKMWRAAAVSEALAA